MNKNKARINLNMSHIRSKDTKPELLLRKELWHRGLRYRKNAKNVIGHPDIVFLRAQIAVFCDGTLWHGYEWDKKKEQINKTFPDKRKSGLHFLHYLTDRKDCRHAASKADAAGRLCCPPL